MSNYAIQILIGMTRLFADSLKSYEPIQLPVPQGKYKVGTFRFILTDNSRHGIYCPEYEARRLPIQVWYPTDANSNGICTSFLESRKVAKLLGGMYGSIGSFIFRNIGDGKTNSIKNAPFADECKNADVLFFSHGYTGYEGQNIVQMEHLASYGYVVFSICHTYEAFAAYFSENEIIPVSKSQINEFNKEVKQYGKDLYNKNYSPETTRKAVTSGSVAKKSVRVWVEDTIFVANQLEKINSGEIKSPLEGRMKLNKFGVFGHSFGGATAADVTLYDDRFSCFINLDGGFYGKISNQKTDKPFMIMQTEISFLEACLLPEQNDFINVIIKDTMHYDFTSFALASPSVKKAGSALVFGSIDSICMIQIINDYILAFFDTYLRGQTNPLISIGKHKYDEVIVKNYLKGVMQNN